MNDDYLTVDQKTFQKMVASRIKEIQEWTTFLKTFHEDYKLAKKTCAAQPKIQFLRRIQVRNFCAMIEAQIHFWKLLTLKYHESLRADLSDGEASILSEKGFDLDEKGSLQTKQLHLQTVKNFMFSSKIFAKVFCCSKQIDFSKEGWVCVKEIFKVRDRLMHPKFVKGVSVADGEIARLVLAEEWFVSETRALFDSQDDFEAIRKKKQSLEGLN